MPQYTEESLDKLLERELIPIVLSLEEQNRSLQSRMSEMNTEVVEEMRKFNENFSLSFNQNSHWNVSTG